MPDKITMTQDEFDLHLNSSYFLGIRIGIEQAQNMLMDKSGEYFVAGQDERACNLRDFGKQYLGKKIEDADAQYEISKNEIENNKKGDN